jgi:class III poly(R)-hydroxyalkanoic acid synthase PhaE subunit
MDQDNKEKSSPDAMFAEWMKTASDFWESAAKTAPFGGFKVPENVQTSAAGYAGRMEEGLQALLKMWQTSASAISSPQTLDSLLKGITASPEAAMRMTRTTWDGYSQLYQMWLKHTGKLGEASKAYNLEGLQPDTIKEWTAFYEKDIQPFLKMPQVGLTRLYQERANDAVDKFANYQVALGEFLKLLNIPVEKSLHDMEEKIVELAKEGKLPENFKDYYNIWIKSLEGHYMTLFHLPEYVECLGKTMNASQDYKVARAKVLMDLLQVLPVPTNRDMNELYKEFYVLKKKVKAMAKKLDKLESLA